MAVVGTAGRGIIVYNLENQPQEVKRIESPLKYQVCFDFDYKNYHILMIEERFIVTLEFYFA